jgi:diguanylate cyclase (GGDEF)-like protein
MSMSSGLPELAALGAALAVAVAAAIHYRRQAALRGSEIKFLREAIVHDPLTGLLNRRGFEARLEIEVQRAMRDGTPLMLVVADLDDFKQINDRLGHLGGDMALERVSGVVARTTRRADAAARLGGEEFAFILPNTSELEAYAFAERLRIATEESFTGTATELTLSLGIAGFPEHGTTPEALLNAADQAMYLSKSLGKNRTALRQAASAQLVAARPAPSA